MRQGSIVTAMALPCMNSLNSYEHPVLSPHNTLTNTTATVLNTLNALWEIGCYVEKSNERKYCHPVRVFGSSPCTILLWIAIFEGRIVKCSRSHSSYIRNNPWVDLCFLAACHHVCKDLHIFFCSKLRSKWWQLALTQLKMITLIHTEQCKMYTLTD